ncbi:zinc metalloprotease HtpX [Tardisphaera miroshnichenkoae]
MRAEFAAKMFGLMFMLGALLFVIGYAVGVYVLGASPIAAISGALAFAFIVNFISYYFSGSMVLRASRARIVSESEAPRVHRIVSELAQRAGIPKPKVAIVDSPQPNAFATGRNEKNAVIAVTTGLLTTMNDNELMGVLGHETGHIIHHDILIATVAASIATAISYLGYIVEFALLFGGFGGNARREGEAFGLLGATLLAPIGALFIQMALSRSREYYADEASARLTGRPDYLISALTKIEAYIRAGAPMKVNPSTSSLWIANPFRGGLSGLLSTHPSTPDRIARLKKIAREMGIYLE